MAYLQLIVVVNMLFLDQPVQVGLSYGSLVNVTVSTSDSSVNVTDFSKGVPEQVRNFRVSTLGAMLIRLSQEQYILCRDLS
jgi:hypothetical protein